MTETAEQRIHSLEQLLSSQPKSPLFAQLADFYLDAGRAKDALALCDRGLAHYPFYTTGHLVKGRVLLALNMKSEARREFEFVQDALPLNESVRRTLAQIPRGEEETLAAPVIETAEPPPAPAAVEAAPRQPSPEAGADQWMTQFTEAGLQQTTGQPAEVQPEAVPAAESFGLQTEEAPAAEEQAGQATEAETFDQFAERKRGELFGLENSLSLEEYLNDSAAAPQPEAAPAAPQAEETPFTESPQEPVPDQPLEDPFATLSSAPEPDTETPPQEIIEDPFATISAEPEAVAVPASNEPVEDPFAQLSQMAMEPEQQETGQNQIEEIAEKLKDAKKITPIINFSEKETTTPSEAETPSGAGFVTPTLAEIYAKQGWYDDAIKAYRALAHSKPLEKDKFEKRIQELEELKRQQDSIG